MFFSKLFIVLHLTYKSMIHFKWLFKVGGLGRGGPFFFPYRCPIVKKAPDSTLHLILQPLLPQQSLWFFSKEMCIRLCHALFKNPPMASHCSLIWPISNCIFQHSMPTLKLGPEIITRLAPSLHARLFYCHLLSFSQPFKIVYSFNLSSWPAF